MDSIYEQISKQQPLSRGAGEEAVMSGREWKTLESQVAQQLVTSKGNRLGRILENWEFL